jgi:hypothetical protein
MIPDQIEQERLAIINSPSIYPIDAIPPQNGPQAAWIQERIEELRSLEPEIANMKYRKAQAFQIVCNAIPAYCANYHNFPRPDGPLDPRFEVWQASVWRKLQNQFRRLADRQKRRRFSPSKTQT